METKNVSRRGFIKSAAALGVMAPAVPLINVRAQNAAKKIKVGLVGCGGRGTGALDNLMDAAKLVGVEIELLATADVFKDKAIKVGSAHGVPEAHCFDGFSGYKKLLELPVELVLLATAPTFRPVHFEAAAAAGKHVFIEKPVAVDPPGVRRVIAAGEVAKQKGLTVVAGTQRRHKAGYLQVARAVQDGLIGNIVGGRVSWCMGALWFKPREPGEDDAHYLVRNWTSFAGMSGDHIVEQHVHQLDVANWLIGRTPKQAVGFGGRARRQTGDQFDFFSVDYDYDNELHIHSMCRQINGTYGGVWEQFIGTKGTTMGGSNMRTFDGKKLELPEIKLPSDIEIVQEHVDLLNSLLQNQGLNGAQTVAYSTLTAIMGRIAAYTGELVRWSDLMEHQDSRFYNLTLTPVADDFEKGAVIAPPDDVMPVPGTDGGNKKNKKGKHA
ncbi:MAG: Gfo/Idh/MocA family oxidoreductase [Verrucomicrobia bacterium]|nr:MAG: Gfo/Idh/MocA family oxidoreductase [Verrucomicrobiota bacterium]